MELLAKQLIMCGLAFVVLAQVVAAVKAFRTSFAEGALSLVVPGYLLLTMRRIGYYWTFFAAWAAGILAIMVVTIILS